jgi:hypothetical protein
MVVRMRVKRTRHRRISAKALKGPKRVKVGFPASKASKSNIEKAIWGEFGTRTIPERPFMRNAMRNNRRKYRQALLLSARKLILAETTSAIVLNKLGILAQGDIQHEITVLTTPPNAASTIKRKGSSKPLIDTGEMRQAVTWLVLP